MSESGGAREELFLTIDTHTVTSVHPLQSNPPRQLEEDYVVSPTSPPTHFQEVRLDNASPDTPYPCAHSRHISEERSLLQQKQQAGEDEPNNLFEYAATTRFKFPEPRGEQLRVKEVRFRDWNGEPRELRRTSREVLRETGVSLVVIAMPFAFLGVVAVMLVFSGEEPEGKQEEVFREVTWVVCVLNSFSLLH